MGLKGVGEEDRAAPTDGALVRRVLAGDTDAYAALVRRHRDRLGRYAVHLLGNREDAEEALQDAFVRAYRALPGCENPDRFDRWLFRILINRCRTTGSQRGRRDRVLVHDDDALADAHVGPTADRAAWGDAIRWAVAQLDPEQREAFLLKHVEELSYDEMVELTGAGVSALKMRVKRACERLRTILQEVERA